MSWLVDHLELQNISMAHGDAVKAQVFDPSCSTYKRMHHPGARPRNPNEGAIGTMPMLKASKQGRWSRCAVGPSYFLCFERYNEQVMEASEAVRS